jgi:nitrile hydratase subunit beta
MNGIHDLGGMHGFGRVEVEPNEPVFHAPWERRVLGMVYLVVGLGWANVDAFRHGIERTDPVDYLTLGYYGRWRASLERILVERGVLAAGEVDARLAGKTTAPPPPPVPPSESEYGFERRRDAAPRFRAGDAVRARVASPAGHTRLPRYVAGRRGVVEHVRAAYIYPDSNASGRGEDPQHLYSVRFDGTELWGGNAEPGTSVRIDLFEPYLEPVDAGRPPARPEVMG